MGSAVLGDWGVAEPNTCRQGAQLYLDHSLGIHSNVLSTGPYFMEVSLELSLGTGIVSAAAWQSVWLIPCSGLSKCASL